MPAIPIICEKLTYLGGTRYEDDTRPPVGITICSGSYAAKALTKARPARREATGAHDATRPNLSLRAHAPHVLRLSPGDMPFVPGPLQTAVEPRFLCAYLQLGVECDFTVQVTRPRPSRRAGAGRRRFAVPSAEPEGRQPCRAVHPGSSRIPCIRAGCLRLCGAGRGAELPAAAGAGGVGVAGEECGGAPVLLLIRPLCLSACAA